jgi:hypothetical protein
MKQPTCRRLGLLVATLLVACFLPGVQAQDLGSMKVQRTDGKWVTGEVQETPNAYIIKVSKSITVTIRKNEVRAILPVQEAGSQPGAKQEQEESENPDQAGGIRDVEVEKLLEGTDLELPTSDLALEESELPLDEESVEEMKRLAVSGKVLTTKHTVIVYTSSEQGARTLAYRLESVWRWNIRFMRLVGLPAHLPDHKLEIYYFGTYDEFNAFLNSMGESGGGGMLGFFYHATNRSHFFDMLTYPSVKRKLEAAKKMKGIERQNIESKAERWAECENISVVQHELGHHIHHNIGLFPRYAWIAPESWDAMPTWLKEGTTMMFEVPPSSEGASLGAVNYQRLVEFQRYYPKDPPPPEWVKIFVVNNKVWHDAGGGFYPMGWGLVYYLWEEKRPGLAKYYHIIAARDPGDAVTYTQREREFEECFGKIDKKWVEDWWKFIRGLPVKKSALPPEGFP